MKPTIYFLAALSFLVSSENHLVSAAPLQVDQAKSIFAVITHRDGFASGMAHNHLIVAEDPTVKLEVPDDLTSGQLSVTVTTDKLIVDLPAQQKEWYPAIKRAGILDEEFTEASTSDRGKIREAMVAPDQLDVAKFPVVSANVTSISPSPVKVGEVAATHSAEVVVTIKGKSITKKVPIRVQGDSKNFEAEAIGAYKFTEFGIEPFSAFLGAVKNSDDFHIYVKVVAKG